LRRSLFYCHVRLCLVWLLVCQMTSISSDPSIDDRLIGGAWRNEDFIFEFDDDGQLKLLSAAGAAKCPYTVDMYATTLFIEITSDNIITRNQMYGE
jgi:hypothetical protein